MNSYLRLIDQKINPLMKLLTYVSVMLAIVVFFYDWVIKEESRLMTAWQVVATRASGNSGKIRALEYLNQRGERLMGIDMSPPNIDRSEDMLSVGVYLAGINLSDADLSMANFLGAHLGGANFSNATLVMSDLRAGFLRQTIFDGANMRGAHFSGSPLVEVSLKDADIRGAIGLSCESLTVAKYWETAIRDDSLKCGAPIPAALK
ncbi:pentapeptide repeat-containing protein [Pseudoalteromonas sp. T1lg23B]|uniref:pentapeptide repeat-containing protein n=1 Tax=Pseudoalteromonas sp. T1lg23B TaxID=2077097 RepID=UPI000CF5FF21|nr:pentapeptide repeat-containing protein [Pseudoalteromonas sp. T1lg23B]